MIMNAAAKAITPRVGNNNDLKELERGAVPSSRDEMGHIDFVG